jgi:hypothetical protein
MKRILLSFLATARFLLTFSPLIYLSLALLSMIMTMILLTAYLRRNEYEDFDIKLPNELLQPQAKSPDTVNLYRLQTFFHHQKSKTTLLTTDQSIIELFFYLLFVDPLLYRQALSKFRSIHQDRFIVRIDWSAGAEIVSIIFSIFAHILSTILATVSTN